MCRREAPAVAEAHTKYGADVTFVGIAGRDDLGPINDFIEEYAVGTFPHIVDESGQIWADFGIVSQPSFIFIDDTGTATSHLGALGTDGLSERLDDLTAT